MKLQKIVFFSHGWYLAAKEESLLDEQVEAWKFGPVISSLYHEIKNYGNNPITDLITILDMETFSVTQPIVEDKETAKFLDAMWDLHKKYTGIQLSNATHIEGSPWHQIISLPENIPLKKNLDIPDRIIKDYFKKLKQAA